MSGCASRCGCSGTASENKRNSATTQKKPSPRYIAKKTTNASKYTAQKVRLSQILLPDSNKVIMNEHVIRQSCKHVKHVYKSSENLLFMLL